MAKKMKKPKKVKRPVKPRPPMQAAPSWKVGDWAVFDRKIVQIMEDRGGGSIDVSDGSFRTSGNNLVDRLRPLTLQSKAAAEWFDWHYRELDKIRGARGFNHPDISSHYNWLMLRAIDGDKAAYDEAQDFLKMARDYTPVIHGVQLFRA